MSTDNIIISITGPSLTGKSNFERLMVERGCVALVSTTTRAPRTGEVDGTHYHFVTKEQFKKIVEQDGLIEEPAEVDGNFYGVQKREVVKALAHGKPVVVVCEPDGAKNIYNYAQAQGWQSFRVFLNNPQQLLVERFLDRFKEDSQATSPRYARRLVNMLTKERVEWVETALDGRAAYEAVFPSFNNENQEQVVDRVMKEALGSSLAKKSAPGPGGKR